MTRTRKTDHSPPTNYISSEAHPQRHKLVKRVPKRWISTDVWLPARDWREGAGGVQASESENPRTLQVGQQLAKAEACSRTVLMPLLMLGRLQSSRVPIPQVHIRSVGQTDKPSSFFEVVCHLLCSSQRGLFVSSFKFEFVCWRHIWR